MFKKSDNQGDKTPKQENKDHVSKTAETAGQSAPKAEKSAAPACEDKKS
ncbi:hypothetical protein [Hyphococcus luteus]|nr:hypothetical protein [Marinicaulis flavus]